MKRNTITSVALSLIILLMGACNSDTWDELPSAISRFVSEYFPFGELSSYTVDDSVATVQIKKGATLVFDSDYDWVDVNGNGAVLPQQFIYDCLPDVLYRYIESMEGQNSVYRVVRGDDAITVDLFDSQLVYNQKTGAITYPSAEGRTGLRF